MRRPMFGDLLDTGRLLRLSARSLSGRLYLAAPLLPLAWPAFLVFQLLIGGREEDYAAHEAQAVIAVPLAVLGILLGVSIIAGEIDRRTLEIAYTVPGGTHRVWLAKFAAGCLTLVAGEMLLAIVVYAFLTSFPPGALYGALQAAVFYLALGMGLAALFKSWVSGALVSVSVLVLNGVFTGFGSVQLRLSPFWNPFVPQFAEFDEVDILSWTVQNRIGFVLATAAVVALAIQRAEQREKLL